MDKGAITISLFRSLPAFRGKQRLARIVFKNAIRQLKDITVKGRYHCAYVLPNIIENVGFELFVNGEYEPEIQALLLSLLPTGGVFIDIGANIGSITVPLSKARPDVTSVSVEAAPWIFKYLEKNVKLNGLENVKMVNLAINDKDGEELDFFSPTEKFGKGSFSPVFTNESVKVSTISLDGLVEKLGLAVVNLLKVDVEGFEYFVFSGGRHLLESQNAPHIVFEFVDWAERNANHLLPGSAQTLLIELGYKLYEIQGRRLVRMMTARDRNACNILATKKELPDLVF